MNAAPPVDPMLLLREILCGHRANNLTPSMPVLEKCCALANALVDERDDHRVRVPADFVRESFEIGDVRALAGEFIAGRAALSPNDVLKLATAVLARAADREVHA